MSIQLNTDSFLAQNTNFGGYYQEYFSRALANSTNANATSGSVAVQRMPSPLTMPSSFGTGVTGCIFTKIDMISNVSNTMILAGIEYDLGSINMSTGAFSDGRTMPSKIVNGVSVQTASIIPMLAVTASVTAVAPAITITYKNQGGTGSRTATLTTANNPLLGSAFCIAPHLQSGDTGIQDITNITKSAGSAGTVHVYGILPLAISGAGTNQGSYQGFDPMTLSLYPYTVEASEIISFYSIGSVTAAGIDASLVGVADN
jgi:hypothetical protein